MTYEVKDQLLKKGVQIMLTFKESLNKMRFYDILSQIEYHS